MSRFAHNLSSVSMSFAVRFRARIVRSRQKHISPELIEFGLTLSRGYITLTRALHEILLTDTADHFGAENEMLLVLLAVYTGDAEGRPMSASKIAGWVGLPRASVYRRLERLMRDKRVERIGLGYRLVPGTMRGDPNGRIQKLLRQLAAV